MGIEGGKFKTKENICLELKAAWPSTAQYILSYLSFGPLLLQLFFLRMFSVDSGLDLQKENWISFG